MRPRYLIYGAVGVVILTALAFVVWAASAMWDLGAGTPMSVHGWIAVAIAFIVTGALGGGLMWLAFYSSRRGWDDIDRDP